MKTTLILNDVLVRRAKSRAALEGCSLSRFMEACLEKGLQEPEPQCVGDWLHLLPDTPESARAEVEDHIRGGGFDDIEPEMWS